MPQDKMQEILAQRGHSYGDFTAHAQLAQQLKIHVDAIDRSSAKKMNMVQQEAMDMILHKVARIANGDPDHEDSWRDIAGYATLAADRVNPSS